MKLYQPFYCGTQGEDWKSRNCYRCKKGYDDKLNKWNCELEGVFDYRRAEGKDYTMKFLKLIGYNHKIKNQYTWDCPKREEV